MPSGYPSRASDSVSPITAHLEAQYATQSAWARLPEPDEMLRMQPLPRSAIGIHTARQQRKVPVTLTAIVLSQVLSDVSVTGASGAIPALLTSPSTRPYRASVRSTREAT